MFEAGWFSDIKVMIFDMDGTLYQEDTFLDRYIRYMLEGTAREIETETAVEEARAILSGSHPIKLGHFYPTSGQPIHIGDPWGIAVVIGHQYNIPAEKVRLAFERVRRDMVHEPYCFETYPPLFEAIARVNTVDKKVLMTNTYEESAVEFMQYMQISRLFDEVYSGAEKPMGIQRYFESLLQAGYQAHQILSIGDNPWNELYPIKQMGGRTCYISPYSSVELDKWDLRLYSLDELEKLMGAIKESRANPARL